MDGQLNKIGHKFSLWLKEEIKSIYGSSYQKKFSNVTGYDSVTVCRWCNGNRIPSGWSLGVIIKTISKEKAKKEEIEYDDALREYSYIVIKTILGENHE